MNSCAIIVLYNPDVKLLLESIEVCLQIVDKIYLIDNSKKYNDLNKIINKTKIDYVNLGKNKGIAYALNVGCRKAIQDGFSWVLTLDQDSIPPSNMISEYFNFISRIDEKIGIIAPRINESNIEINKNFWLREVVQTSGSFMNLDAYKEVNGFKDSFFIDGVDYEYCLRINTYNYKIFQLNNVVLNHSVNDGTNAIKLLGTQICFTSSHNYARLYYIVRNYLWLIENYSTIYPNFCISLKNDIKVRIIKVLFFEKDKKRKIRAIWNGYIDFKNNNLGKYKY